MHCPTRPTHACLASPSHSLPVLARPRRACLPPHPLLNSARTPINVRACPLPAWPCTDTLGHELTDLAAPALSRPFTPQPCPDEPSRACPAETPGTKPGQPLPRFALPSRACPALPPQRLAQPGRSLLRQAAPALHHQPSTSLGGARTLRPSRSCHARQRLPKPRRSSPALLLPEAHR